MNKNFTPEELEFVSLVKKALEKKVGRSSEVYLRTDGSEMTLCFGLEAGVQERCDTYAIPLSTDIQVAAYSAFAVAPRVVIHNPKEVPMIWVSVFA